MTTTQWILTDLLIEIVGVLVAAAVIMFIFDKAFKTALFGALVFLILYRIYGYMTTAQESLRKKYQASKLEKELKDKLQTTDL